MDSTNSTCEILNSWKEVADYLGRGTRTVQRWEHDLGLPVRRPRGKSRSAVMALRQELDAWVGSRPQAGLHQENGQAPGSVFTHSTRVPIGEAILASRGLRSQNRQLRAEMSVALHSLVSSSQRILEKILGQPLYPAANVAGYTHFQGLHGNGKPYQPEGWPMARALKGQGVNGSEVTCVRSDGSHVDLTVSSAPVLDQAGRVVAVVTLFFELLQNRQAQ